MRFRPGERVTAEVWHSEQRGLITVRGTIAGPLRENRTIRVKEWNGGEQWLQSYPVRLDDGTVMTALPEFISPEHVIERLSELARRSPA